MASLARNGGWETDVADLVVPVAATVYQRPVILFTPHLGIVVTAPLRAMAAVIDANPITLTYTGNYYNIATTNNDPARF